MPQTLQCQSKLIFRVPGGLSFIAFVAALFCAFLEAHAEDVKTTPHAFMGAGSCASSNCHGAVAPRNGNDVMQNEYVTWQKHDMHSQAWLVLGNEQSKRIAHNLAIRSAEKSSLCLRCHSTPQNEDSRHGTSFSVEDGVSCEACHGAAEDYLGAHTATDATHASNLTHGMRDMVSADKRAVLCLGCHFGNNEASVTHRLIGAGHPRLTFELDTFSIRQPKHWRIDEDYLKRKEDYVPAQAWLVGQLERAKQQIAVLGSDRARDGVYPELTIFYCYSCHHNLSEGQYKTHEYDGRPGQLVPNLSSLLMIQRALTVLDPIRAKELHAELAALPEELHQGKSAAINAVPKTLSQITDSFNKKNFEDAQLTRLLASLIEFASAGNATQYEIAEQIAMGSAALLSQLSPDGSLHKAELHALFNSLATPHQFRADAFQEAAKRFFKK